MLKPTLQRILFFTAREIAIIMKENTKLLNTSLFLFRRDGLNIQQPDCLELGQSGGRMWEDVPGRSAWPSQ
jgi:hypothetical protein